MRTEREHQLRLNYLHKQSKVLKRVAKTGWTDIDLLEYQLYSIHPYSLAWRSGMIRALKHAIRLMKAERKQQKLLHVEGNRNGHI